MCNYAYIRVSSREQNVARQVEAMLEIGIKKRICLYQIHFMNKRQYIVTYIYFLFEQNKPI